MKKAGIIIYLVAVLFSFFFIGEVVFRFYYSSGRVLGSDVEEKCNRELYEEVSNVSNPNRFFLDPVGDYNSILEYSSIYGEIPVSDYDEKINFSYGFSENIVIYGDLTTNSQHMRGLKGESFSLDKDPKILRIALLGDSYTWGAEVPYKFSFPLFLEEFIPNSEVLNFAIFGVGIDMMYLRWKYEALKFNPDVVIMNIYTNNIARARPCLNKPKLEIEGENIILKNVPPPRREEIANTYTLPKFESYFIKHVLYNFKFLRGDTSYEYGFKLLPYMLKEMKEKSENDRTYFLVTIINAGGKPSDEELKQYTRLKELLESMSVDYLESFEIFRNEGYSPYDDRLYGVNLSKHFSPLGNALFSQGIKRKLKKEGIIKSFADYYFKFFEDEMLDIPSLNTIIKSGILLMENKINSSDKEYVVPFYIYGGYY